MSHLKTIRRALRRPFETFFFRLATWVIPLIPRVLINFITTIAGWLTFHVATRERIVGMANLDIVFGETKTREEKQTILKKSLISFTRTMADIFWFSMWTEKRLLKYQRFVPDSGPYFEERAHVIITAHAGNWELIGLESGLLGIDVASIAAVTKNKAVDRLLNDLREKTGMTIIPREGAMRTLVSRFRNQGKAAFVLDQNTPEEEGGVWVDFLGMPTPVSSAPANLAYRTGTDIIFAFSHPTSKGVYEARTGPIITPPPFDKTADQKKIATELTQRIMDVVSDRIRTHPESWLWAYKHWRHVAPGSDPSIYPDYP